MNIDFIKTDKGQSMVEYIMLLVVVVSFALIIFKHPKFAEMLGPNGTLYTKVRKNIEHSYKHAYPYTEDDTDVDFPGRGVERGEHLSYFSKGQTRFFQTLAYPKN
ncbi:MAG: hypothetical protein HQK51_10315 [Oligoflexia bacterium]|nr:hypothetical protein [Oligoflexia bacterium]